MSIVVSLLARATPNPLFTQISAKARAGLTGAMRIMKIFSLVVVFAAVFCCLGGRICFVVALLVLPVRLSWTVG
jgi:hypothetical protein